MPGCAAKGLWRSMTRRMTLLDTNSIIIAFMSQNWIAIMVTVNLLKGIAILTPSTKDDSVITLISNTYDAIRNLGKEK
jgi:hypothetical protein